MKSLHPLSVLYTSMDRYRTANSQATLLIKVSKQEKRMKKNTFGVGFFVIISKKMMQFMAGSQSF